MRDLVPLQRVIEILDMLPDRFPGTPEITPLAIDELHALADSTRTERDALAERVEKLHAALRGLFAMVENGMLVRDTSRDHEPGWAMKMLPLVSALQAAEAALAAPTAPKEAT